MTGLLPNLLELVAQADRWIGMPIEFLHGRPLGPDELDMIRMQIESGFDTIEAIDPEVRGIVERNWPHLLAKLPPEETD